MKSVYVVYKVQDNDLVDVEIFTDYHDAKEYANNNNCRIWERPLREKESK